MTFLLIKSLQKKKKATTHLEFDNSCEPALFQLFVKNGHLQINQIVKDKLM
jgi:hypothetical protein